MKHILKTLVLYIVLVTAVFTLTPLPAFAACQVIYGGGQICQNQKDVTSTYKIIPTATPTPVDNQTQSVPPTSTLPSTGTSFWGLLLIGASGLGGTLLLLL